MSRARKLPSLIVYLRDMNASHEHYVHCTYTRSHLVATYLMIFGDRIVGFLHENLQLRMNGGKGTSLSACEAELSFTCAIRTYARRPKSITVSRAT